MSVGLLTSVSQKRQWCGVKALVPWLTLSVTLPPSGSGSGVRRAEDAPLIPWPLIAQEMFTQIEHVTEIFLCNFLEHINCLSYEELQWVTV